MWVIGIEVGQETSAPPPKKILGPPLTSATLFSLFSIVLANQSHIAYQHKTRIKATSKSTAIFLFLCSYRTVTNKRLQNSYSSSVQVKYLSKIHTRWISNHCAISLSVPSIFNKLRVPHTEVFIWFFPLWKNSDSWPQISAICRVLQMCLQSLKHPFRGSHVTSIKNLIRKNKLFLTVVWKTKLK